MIEISFKAGIPRKQIRLALEPEVASIYAKEVYLERSRNMVQQPNASFGQGTKFIVLDLGGNLMYNQKNHTGNIFYLIRSQNIYRQDWKYT